jgi:hypothetical protein
MTPSLRMGWASGAPRRSGATVKACGVTMDRGSDPGAALRGIGLRGGVEGFRTGDSVP